MSIYEKNKNFSIEKIPSFTKSKMFIVAQNSRGEYFTYKIDHEAEADDAPIFEYDPEGDYLAVWLPQSDEVNDKLYSKYLVFNSQDELFDLEGNQIDVYEIYNKSGKNLLDIIGARNDLRRRMGKPKNKTGEEEAA